MADRSMTELRQLEFPFPFALSGDFYAEKCSLTGTPRIEFTGILIHKSIAGIPITNVELRSPPALKGKIYLVDESVFIDPAIARIRKHGMAVEGFAYYEPFSKANRDPTRGWRIYRLEPLGSLNDPFPMPQSLWHRLCKRIRRN